MDKKSEVGSLQEEVRYVTAMGGPTVVLMIVCSFVCTEVAPVTSAAALVTLILAPVLRDWAAGK